jgi:GNAT superfamily N-acetyltransferase
MRSFFTSHPTTLSCGAQHIYRRRCAALGAHVAEVPSIAVRPEARGLKAGSKLLPYLRYLKDQRREFSSLQKKEHKL